MMCILYSHSFPYSFPPHNILPHPCISRIHLQGSANILSTPEPFRNVSAHCRIPIAMICITFTLVKTNLYMSVPCPVYVLCSQSVNPVSKCPVAGSQAACTMQIYLTLLSTKPLQEGKNRVIQFVFSKIIGRIQRTY